MAYKSELEDLVTVRDWVRFAASEFRRAKLVFGHGTSSAVDEAAYLTLFSLNLPISELEPWLDARLTRGERERLLELISKRIESRKPAPYLTNEAWVQGVPFYVDERVIVPRSYIGELMATTGLVPAVDDPHAVMRVLDLCTGSGCLAILAAYAFPNAAVVGADVSAAALQVAERNVTDHGLEDRVTLVKSDLFDGVEGEFDLIISNPPYVTSAAVDAFPPEFKAEPTLAHLGGEDGLDLTRRILADARGFLTANGSLVVEVGHAGTTLAEERLDLPFIWLETEESEGEVFVLDHAHLS